MAATSRSVRLQRNTRRTTGGVGHHNKEEEWTGVNTNATFDYTTGALTNANTFAASTATPTSARRIQLGARFTF